MSNPAKKTRIKHQFRCLNTQSLKAALNSTVSEKAQKKASLKNARTLTVSEEMALTMASQTPHKTLMVPVKA